MKILVATVVLTIAPGLAVAQCFGHAAKEQTAMSCAPGTVLDEDTKTCVPTTG